MIGDQNWSQGKKQRRRKHGNWWKLTNWALDREWKFEALKYWLTEIGAYHWRLTNSLKPSKYATTVVTLFIYNRSIFSGVALKSLSNLSLCTNN